MVKRKFSYDDGEDGLIDQFRDEDDEYARDDCTERVKKHKKKKKHKKEKKEKKDRYHAEEEKTSEELVGENEKMHDCHDEQVKVCIDYSFTADDDDHCETPEEA